MRRPRNEQDFDNKNLETTWKTLQRTNETHLTERDALRDIIDGGSFLIQI